MRENTFIFICGLHRSGTSILFKCLREHPLISGFNETGVPEDEGQHLQSVYPTAMFYGGPGRFGFSGEAHLTEYSLLANKENSQKLFSQWEPYWDTTKPYLMEKSPPNLIRTRFLQRLFPNSYFIVLTRHPVAVTMASVKWTKTALLNNLIKHWLVCHEIFQSDAAFLMNVRVMKYERFVADPQGCLDSLYSFIGIDSHPNNLQIRSDINQNYFDNWTKLRNLPVARSYLDQAIAKYESRINRFGYSLTNLEVLDEEPVKIAG